MDFVGAHAGPRVLDLGCGLGGYSKALAERGFDVRALDVSAEYVERARGLGVAAETLRRQAHAAGGRRAWTR